MAAPAESEKQVEECLRLLRSSSDEERFVGLILITKVVKDPDHHTLIQVSDAVGSDFIDRLLLSKGEYTGFVVSLLSTLCQVPQLAQDPRMIARALPVLSCLEGAEDEDTVCDSLQTLAALAEAPDTAVQVCTSPAFEMLLTLARGASTS